MPIKTTDTQVNISHGNGSIHDSLINSPIMLLNERIIKLLLNVTKANLGNMPTAPDGSLSYYSVCLAEENYLTYSKHVGTEILGPGFIVFEPINPEREIRDIDDDEAEIEAV